MKSLQIQIPAKTFLAGEYLALKGLGALVFCSKPFHQFDVLKAAQAQNPFHPDSPAGKFWNLHQDYFKNFNIQYRPQGLKGFGTSTAEFICVHLLWQMQDSIWIEQERFTDIHQMLKDYQVLAQTEKQIPSGADLVAQVCGGIIYFHKESGKIQTFAWPFQEISLLLLKTPTELKTHEHLNHVGDFNYQDLERILQQMHVALKEVDQDKFVQAFQAYGEELKNLGFWSQESQDFSKTQMVPGVLAQKGCGAMGADVVAFLVDKKSSLNGDSFKSLIATDLDLASGVKIILNQERSLEY